MEIIETMSDLLKYCERKNTYITGCKTEDGKIICFTKKGNILEFKK